MTSIQPARASSPVVRAVHDPLLQTATQTPTPDRQLTIQQQTAHPNFPDTITFTLKASGFPASRALLLYRVVGEATTSQVKADIQGAITSTLDLQVTLDLATGYIPPGAEVEYYWSLADAAGNRVDTPYKTFALMDTRFQWRGIGDERRILSVFRYEGDEAFGQFLYNTATGALHRLERALGTTLERPVNIWVYASEDDLLGANPQGVAEWIGGRAFPEMGLALVAIADDENGRSEIKRIIPHELSHILLYQATRNPYNTPPAWLDEGLAVYNEESADPAYEATLKVAAERGELRPLRALAGSFSADEDDVTIDYAQSRSVVAFILESPKYGPERLARSIAAFRDGVTHDEALQRGLGLTTDELDREWRASLPYRLATPTATPSPLQAIPTPPASPQDNTLLFLSLGIALGIALAAVVALVLVLPRRKRNA